MPGVFLSGPLSGNEYETAGERTGRFLQLEVTEKQDESAEDPTYLARPRQVLPDA